MGRGLHNPEQTKSFDLLGNPFHVLGIEPSASFEQITKAYDDAVAKEPTTAPDLADARKTLLNTRQRTTAELSFLLDTQDGEVSIVLDGLKKAASFQDIALVADNLAPLSRANLLAHAASHDPAGADLLFALVDAHARITPDAVYAKLRAERSKAGVGVPGRESVDEDLQELLTTHCKAALVTYETSRACAEAIAECTTRVLASADPNRIDALGRMVHAFEAIIVPDLSLFEREFESGAQSIRARPKEIGLLDPIVASLRNWISLARPLVELEAYKGREEERARRLFSELRSLSLEMADEHDSSELALSITRVAVEVFKLLPHATEQLMEDVQLLHGHAPEANIVPLQKWIEEYHEDFGDLVKDLEARGFDQRSIGKVKELWDHFAVAAKKMEFTNVADLPWFMVQNVAIAINNRQGSPRAAKSLIDGMLAFSQNVAPSPTVYGLLSKDLRLAEHNILQKKLADHIKANRVSPALQTIAELQKNLQSAEEGETLNSLKSQLNKKKRTARTLKLSAVIVLAGITIYGAISKKISGYDNWPSFQTSNVSVSPSVQKAQRPIESKPATKPTPPVEQAITPSTAPQPALPAPTTPTQTPIQIPSPPTDRVADADPATSASPDLDLLQIEVSTNVQKRLGELGYFRGPTDGTWGPQSRSSLRVFKQANGLGNDDAFDAATGTRLFSLSAIRGQPQAKDAVPRAATSETNYPPPPGATLNPLNRQDALKIHTKLRDLGFYRSPNLTLWSSASRDALKDFKISSQLSADNNWDASTEQRLITAGPALIEDIEAGFFAATGGSWSIDMRACSGASGGSDALVMTIIQKRATTDDAYCEFSNLSGHGATWKALGTCVVNGESKKSNINLNRNGNVLVWSSANGTTKYLRCR
jgi:peptidoglycan hydrolase-like protein with peptidoglycan-binding domain